MLIPGTAGGIDITEANGTVRVRLQGEIDLSCARHVRAEIGQYVGLDDVQTIELDLSEVTFLDSTGIGIVVGTQQRAKGAGQRFDLVAVSPTVRKVLEHTGVAL